MRIESKCIKKVVMPDGFGSKVETFTESGMPNIAAMHPTFLQKETVGYGEPDPSDREHVYEICVYTLDAMSDIEDGFFHERPLQDDGRSRPRSDVYERNT